MPSSLNGTGITFSDSSTQSTAATAAALVTTTNVLNATAGASAGAVGTYAFLSSQADTAFNGTRAGSSLRTNVVSRYSDCNYIAALNDNTGATQSGTWRCMGNGSIGGATGRVTVWLRIS